MTSVMARMGRITDAWRKTDMSAATDENDGEVAQEPAGEIVLGAKVDPAELLVGCDDGAEEGDLTRAHVVSLEARARRERGRVAGIAPIGGEELPLRRVDRGGRDVGTNREEC
jgi:hypothetical protein